MRKTSIGVLVFVVAALWGSPHNAKAAAGIPCADGNDADGDCCSSAFIQEEHRWGNAALTVPCLNGFENVCEDGVDNDGDGLYDAEDPECSSLSALQEYAVLAIDTQARASVRSGSTVRLLHTAKPPQSAPGFPVSGATCTGGACVCPPLTGPFGLPPAPPMITSNPIPDCQQSGRACAIDADCDPYQYPKGVSTAALCGGNLILRRDGVYEGFVATVGDTQFARGYVGSRNLLNLGSFFLNNGGAEDLGGEPPWVGPGLCSDLLTSCTNDDDCTVPNLCEGRYQLTDAGNHFVDRTGMHPLWLDCSAAITTDLSDIADKIKNQLPGHHLAPGPGVLASGSLNVGASDPSLTLNFPNGTTVIDAPAITLGKGAQLTLNGQANSTVVFRTNRLKIGGTVNVTLGGGLMANNLLWLIEDAGGPVIMKRNTSFPGTILTSERKTIRLGSEITVDGALLGRRVEIRDTTTINHRPFTALFPVNLKLTKTDNPDPVVAGEPLTYTITVVNTGFSNAPGVVVTDTLPSDVDFSTASASQGNCVNDSGIVTCTLGTLGPQGSSSPLDTATITITVTPHTNFRGNISNTATVVENVEELDPADNTDTESTHVTGISDLKITKTDTDPVIAGVAESLTYTLTIQNFGPSDAIEGGGVTVVDTLPAGVTFVSATHTPESGAAGTCQQSGSTISCPIGGLNVGETDTIVVVVTPDCTLRGTITNTASVTSGGETDPVPANNSDSEDTTINTEADLSSSMTASPNPVLASADVLYTITVNDAGPSSATNVVVTDVLPIGTTFNETGSSPECTAVGQTVTCTIASVTCGGSANRTIVATVAPSVAQNATLSNNVTAIVRDEPDGNGGNDTSFADVSVYRQADLSIAKNDNTETQIPGTDMFYNIVVTNAGPSDASDAVISDVFPPAYFSNVTWVCFPSSGAGCAAPTGNGGLNEATQLPVGASVVYAVHAHILSSATGMLSNTATVQSEPGALDDPNLGDNSATDTDDLTPQADLSITKTDNPDPVTVGSNLNYTLTVTNNGPSDAPNAVVVDTFPSVYLGATWTCTSSGGASCPTAMGAGNINEAVAVFPAGGQIVYAISGGTAQPPMGSNVTNSASVTAPFGVTETNPANNSQTISTQFYTPTFTPTSTPTRTPTRTPTNTPTRTPTHVSDTVVYVSSTLGTAMGDGSRDFPVNTIQGGILLAQTYLYTDVCVSVGTYNETITLISGINVTGKFSADGSWVPNSAGTTTINGAATGAVVGNGVSGVALKLLDIKSANAVGAGNSSYGVRLLSSTVTLANNSITSGNGVAGTAGTVGANGSPAGAAGANGPNSGSSGTNCGSQPATGGAGGGQQSCAVGNSGAGGGGTAGKQNATSSKATPGATATPGPPVGGAGGNSGNAVGGGNNGLPGSAGTPGAVGAAGSAGANFGAAATLYTPAPGGTGGTGGNGGGGGGGSGSGGNSFSCFLVLNAFGGGGGGGGSGGCGATGGTGGTGGGGSFPVWISGGNVTLTSNTITRGNGGTGGAGATGGTGASGGGGGSGGSGAKTGGAGGAGGAGGNGGQGGGGGGGPTVGVVCTGSPTITCSGNSHTAGTPGSGGTGGTAGTTGLNANNTGTGCGSC